MYAEDFLELLAEKNLVSSEFLDERRRRFARNPHGTSAAEFADRLVREGVLSVSLSEALLRQLGRRQPPVPPPLPSSSPPPLPPVPPPLPQSAPVFSDENVFPDRRRNEEFSRKRRPPNPWDTKLILFGGAGLLLLVLAVVFFTGSLFRRGAETMYSTANEAYEKGNYSRAIVDYTEYLSAFPNHSGAPTARVRRALARIRLLVDSGTDWTKTFETAETEIAAVKDEPVFFDESKGELAALLPEIATALAAEAKEKTSIFHAEQGQRALDLIDELLPRSLRPVEKLAEAKSRIDGVRRLLVRDDALDETRRQLDAVLAETPFDAGRVARGFEAIDSLVDRYPELENEENFLELLRRLSETESRAVQTVPDEKFASENVFGQKTPPLPSIAPYQRTLNKEAPVENGSTVLLHASGTLFALRADDGTPIWRKPWNSTAPRIVRIPPTALIVDPAARSIERLDVETGKTLWSVSFDERFFLSEPVVVDSRTVVAASTVSGRVTIFVFGTEPAPEIRGFRLPRPIDSPPVVDPAGKRIFQFAERATLFSLPLEPSDAIHSFFTAHKATTIRAAPSCFGENILFVRQIGVRTGELVVLSTEKDVLQRFPIQGLVDIPIVRNETYLALTSDEGEASLWERTGVAATPLKRIAQGSAGGQADGRGTTRHTILDGNTVWVADRQLMRFETQPAQSRLFPKDSVVRNIVTTAAPYRSGRVLLHTFRRPGLGGVSVEAVSLDDATVLWETEVADPIVLEPRPDPARTDSVTIYTSTGRSYRIDLNSDEYVGKFLDTPVDRLQQGIFGEHPLGRVVPLRDGFAAWIPRRSEEPASGNRLLMIFDPEAPESTRFKSLLMSIPFAAPPTALDGNLLIPLADGRIVLIDPKTREPAAEPFLPVLSERAPPRWTEPVVDAGSKEAFVVDDTVDSVALYRIVLESKDGKPALVLRHRLSLEHPIAFPPVVFGNEIVLVDKQNTLRVVACEENGMKVAFSEPQAAACVWGPRPAGNRVFWATADGKLHALDVDMKRNSIAAPIPVGEPFSDKNGVLLVSATGTLWNVDPESVEIRFTLETGVRTRVGPIRIGERILLSGQDGAVYEIEKK